MLNYYSSKFFFAVFAFLSINFNAFCQQQKYSINDILKFAKPEQPRILYTFEVQEKIEEDAEDDSLSEARLNNIIAEAVDIANLPLVDYTIDSKGSLEFASKELYRRIITLVIASRHTGRKDFFDKVIAEMDKAVSLNDWGPENFRATSNMTIAVSLGYDWLYTSLEWGNRKKYNEAIFRMGLKEGLKMYEKLRLNKRTDSTDWVINPSYNCVLNNSAMLIGALALARDYPQISSSIITYAVNSLSNALRGFPLSIIETMDLYAKGNLTLCVSALKYALNNDFSLSKSLGYSLIYNSYIETQINNAALSMIKEYFVEKTPLPK